jgi:hypothetical protein
MNEQQSKVQDTAADFTMDVQTLFSKINKKETVKSSLDFEYQKLKASPDKIRYPVSTQMQYLKDSYSLSNKVPKLTEVKREALTKDLTRSQEEFTKLKSDAIAQVQERL